MESELKEGVGLPHRRLWITDSPRGPAGAAINAGQGAGRPSVPLTPGFGLAHWPAPRVLSCPGKDRLLQSFPDRTETEGLWFGLHRFLGHRRSLKPASVEQRPVPGEHLCPPAPGLAASQPFCRAVCDLVCLNGNLGLWPDSLAVCFTNSYLQSQIRLIKEPASHGARHVTQTSGECVYEAGMRCAHQDGAGPSGNSDWPV